MNGPVPERLLIVPDRAGESLVPLVRAEKRDDVDGLFDELLGEDTTDGPGVADLILFTAGVGGVVWGTWISNTPLVVVAVIVGLLGVVLPLRSLGRRMRARRSAGAIEQARIRSGVLSIDAAPAAELAEQYGRLLAATTAADAAARDAALTAVREVASLLDGRSPSGAAETEYVIARSLAVGRMAQALADRPPVDGSQAVVEARNELDAISGSGSLAQIDAVLNRHLDR